MSPFGPRRSGDRVVLVLLQRPLRLLQRVAAEGITQLLGHHAFDDGALAGLGGFEQGIAEGSFRPLDAARAAEMFLGAVIITTEQQTTLGEKRPVEGSVSTLMDLFLKGLEPRR